VEEMREFVGYTRASRKQREIERERERERVHVCVMRSYISTVPSHCQNERVTGPRREQSARRTRPVRAIARWPEHLSAICRYSSVLMNPASLLFAGYRYCAVRIARWIAHDSRSVSLGLGTLCCSDEIYFSCNFTSLKISHQTNEIFRRF